MNSWFGWRIQGSLAGSSGSGSITGHSHLKAELEQDPLPSSDTWFPVEWCTDYSLQAVLKSLTTCSSPKGSSLQPLVSAEDVGERLSGSTAVFLTCSWKWHHFSILFFRSKSLKEGIAQGCQLQEAGIMGSHVEAAYHTTSSCNKLPSVC